MFRAQLPASTILETTWQKKMLAQHRARIKQVKPSIDNKEPRNRYLGYNAKRALQDEEKYRVIEQQNKKLLARMESIMSQRNTLDNHNESFQLRSLNIFMRKRQTRQITMENLAILKRIEDRPSMYSHHRWAAEAERQEALLKNICRFPLHAGYKRSGSPSSPNSPDGPARKQDQWLLDVGRSQSAPPMRGRADSISDMDEDDVLVDPPPPQYQSRIGSQQRPLAQSLPKLSSPDSTVTPSVSSTKPADAAPVQKLPSLAKTQQSQPATSTTVDAAAPQRTGSVTAGAKAATASSPVTTAPAAIPAAPVSTGSVSSAAVASTEVSATSTAVTSTAVTATPTSAVAAPVSTTTSTATVTSVSSVATAPSAATVSNATPTQPAQPVTGSPAPATAVKTESPAKLTTQPSTTTTAAATPVSPAAAAVPVSTAPVTAASAVVSTSAAAPTPTKTASKTAVSSGSFFVTDPPES
eukprot:TRINITY_DN13603_c0_g1_i1.p1 TRINITY_DN13603_c0_g1~~TRINITY_DN13603_c0_g1_i1.p1  ORF type:complete len:469 (+),score=108.95 TRINITY_DN13603_c0_g1_i1:88-1494(+)